MNFKYIKKDG
nr:RecName: Full=Unknown protein from 2D-PAGE from elementary body [Chlamydia trachomatis 434/Bu]